MPRKQTLHASDLDLAVVQCALQVVNEPDVSTITDGGRADLWDAARRALGLRPSPIWADTSFGRRVSQGPPDAAMKAANTERHTTTLVEVQRSWREMLQQASEGKKITVTFEGHITLDGPDLSYRGRDVDMLRFGLAWSLANSLSDRIKRCPECNRFFLRIRRQIYCRDECTDRVTWRNYPEEKKQKARLNAKHGESPRPKRAR